MSCNELMDDWIDELHDRVINSFLNAINWAEIIEDMREDISKPMEGPGYEM